MIGRQTDREIDMCVCVCVCGKVICFPPEILPSMREGIISILFITAHRCRPSRWQVFSV